MSPAVFKVIEVAVKEALKLFGSGKVSPDKLAKGAKVVLKVATKVVGR